jgi:hypothetical protein
MENITKVPLCKGEGCRQYTGKVNQGNCLYCQRRLRQKGIKMEIKKNWFEQAQEDLKKLEYLKPGWDGYNCPSIETAAITQASRFVSFLLEVKENKTNESDIGLEIKGMNNGGIKLVIPIGLKKNDESDGIEIEFDRNGIVFFQFVKSQGENIRELYSSSIAKIFAKLIDSSKL